MAKAQPKTLNDFRAAHDKNVIVPAKVRKALETMVAEGPENWEYEADFLKRASVNPTEIGMFRDQFAEHIVETGGKSGKRIWFGSAKVAAKARS